MSAVCAACGGNFSAAGLKKHSGQCKPERDAEIVRRRCADESHRQIGRALGIPYSLVKRVLDRQGVEARPAGRDRRVRLPVVPEYKPGVEHSVHVGRCKECLFLLDLCVCAPAAARVA